MEKIFYLAQVFQGLNVVGTVFLVMSTIAICVLIPLKYSTLDPDEDSDTRTWKTITRWIRRSWSILIVSILMVVFIPEKKTFLFMVGGKAVDTLVDKTNIEEIPGNTINLLNEYIKAETEGIKQRNYDEQRLHDRD
jgi:hypothetical protein